MIILMLGKMEIFDISTNSHNDVELNVLIFYRENANYAILKNLK
jgi:hypothetical protein